MPGFLHWPLDAAFAQIAEAGITRVICLEEEATLLDRSPAYWRALTTGDTAAPTTWLQVKDYGVPDDIEVYLGVVRDVAAALRAGERVLVHCAGGCGRSGTFAGLVLVALGSDPAEAEAAYRRACGCGPESEAQRAFLRSALSA